MRGYAAAFLQCVAVCCSVLQCVAVCSSEWQCDMNGVSLNMHTHQGGNNLISVS